LHDFAVRDCDAYTNQDGAKYPKQRADKTRIAGPEKLTPGKHTIDFGLKYDGGGLSKGGLGILSVDDKKVAERRIERTSPVGKFTLDESFDVGEDTGMPVIDDYEAKMPFKFTGKLEKVEIKLGPDQLTPKQRGELEQLKRDFATRFLSSVLVRLALLGGAAVWPVAAQAHPTAMPVVARSAVARGGFSRWQQSKPGAELSSAVRTTFRLRLACCAHAEVLAAAFKVSPTETQEAQDFRSAKGLLVLSLWRDIVGSIAWRCPRARRLRPAAGMG
jgi:hypothetical protein